MLASSMHKVVKINELELFTVAEHGRVELASVLFVVFHKVRLFLGHVPHILVDRDVDCFERLLKVIFNHVYILSHLVL